MKLTIHHVAVSVSSRQIVSNIDLAVQPGEIVGLVGPNGSGKSTILRTVYRMLRPSAGFVQLGDDDVWQMSPRTSARQTAAVVQESTHDVAFTVAKMVQMGRTPHKGFFAGDTDHDWQVTTTALARVQMLDCANRPFNTLSGGEKQRVLIARALAQEPQLLVLDEPTNHLDIHYQLDILELVRSLGITTLVTVHDLNLAAAYCDRLYVLSAGTIVAEGTPEQVLTPHWLRDIFLVNAVIQRHPVTNRIQLALFPLSHRHEGG
ncbi:MAG TPA: ABC transporter ATP-binding protein [Herpetosiphon sp.]|uniref:ABC transporter related n=1 Tax=Herpetosiphon aurantiacus (strain ATCC 23779 / DSM 785 / 114-95) TaxID=316274 RepID=A9AW89_HERA2|nr:ABC transporter ATP-binding protein [Herpetosiphon sp.]ABX04739.1 ABC transporter related [Herpetosiphon aurantiacus DSM 785]HBW49962.1 ABC transporter ATP-binding protein [Herpetosiphon sp.]